jgi:hypothetical protein
MAELTATLAEGTARSLKRSAALDQEVEDTQTKFVTTAARMAEPQFREKMARAVATTIVASQELSTSMKEMMEVIEKVTLLVVDLAEEDTHDA